MPYIRPEVVAEARKVDLLSYLQATAPGELVKCGGNEYCTRTHDSLKISNGKWFWWSRGIGGVSALDYLVKVCGVDFVTAVEAVMGKAVEIPSFVLPEKRKSDGKLYMPRYGKEYTPEELSSEYLRVLKKNVEDANDIEIGGAVITVPAYFNEAQRTATMRAGKKAGLDVLKRSLTMSCSCSVLMTPIYSKNEIEDCRLKIDRAKATIREKITPKTTDEQKVRLVAEHLVYNTTYEINNRYNQNAASALCFGKAQCRGISKAFKLLMDDLGVYCISVSGEAIDEQGNAHAFEVHRMTDLEFSPQAD